MLDNWTLYVCTYIILYYIILYCTLTTLKGKVCHITFNKIVFYIIGTNCGKLTKFSGGL